MPSIIGTLAGLVVIIALAIFIPVVVIDAVRHHTRAIGAYVAVLLLAAALSAFRVGPFGLRGEAAWPLLIIWLVLFIPVILVPPLAWLRFERWRDAEKKREAEERAASRAAQAAQGAEWLASWGKVETTAPTWRRPPKA